MSEDNEFLEQILLSEPSPTTVRLILSRFMEQGQYGRVIQYGERRLRHDSYDVELMQLLIRAYEKAGFLGKAEDMLERACSAVDHFSLLFKELAELYASRRRNEEAIVCLKKYLSHHPEDGDAIELLGLLQKREEIPGPQDVPQEPQEPLRPSEVEPPASQETPTLQDLATPTLAEIYFNQGQIHDAIEIYESVLQRHPDDFEAARRLKELKAMLEEPAQEGQDIDQQKETVAARNERMIGILESWLGRIQEMNRAL